MPLFQASNVNTDPEYIEVYSLPVCFAKLFHNCAYLEYPSLGKFPDPPEDGVYVPSGGDIGSFCCLRNQIAKDNNEKSDAVDDEVEEVA